MPILPTMTTAPRADTSSTAARSPLVGLAGRFAALLARKLQASDDMRETADDGMLPALPIAPQGDHAQDLLLKAGHVDAGHAMEPAQVSTFISQALAQTVHNRLVIPAQADALLEDSDTPAPGASRMPTIEAEIDTKVQPHPAHQTHADGKPLLSPMVAVAAGDVMPMVPNTPTAQGQQQRVDEMPRAQPNTQALASPVNVASAALIPLAAERVDVTPMQLAPVTPLNAGAITIPLHHPQWTQALGQQVLQLTQTHGNAPQLAQLHLNPPELGPLRIAIEMHQHVVHASFVSAHAAVRLAVEHALPDLQTQLEQSGISLGQTHVGTQEHAEQESAATAAFSQPRTPSRAKPAVDVEHSMPQPRATHTLIDTFA